MDFKAGDKVIFTSEMAHERSPMFYPEVGTVGEIIAYDRDSCLVKWPDGSTSDHDTWFACPSHLNLFEDKSE